MSLNGAYPAVTSLYPKSFPILSKISFNSSFVTILSNSCFFLFFLFSFFSGAFSEPLNGVLARGLCGCGERENIKQEMRAARRNTSLSD